MKRTLLTLILALTTSFSAFSQEKSEVRPKLESQSKTDASDQVDQEVIKKEKEWVEAWAHRDRAALDRLLAEDHIDISVSGKANTKAASLESLTKGVPTKREEGPFNLSEINVKVFGDAAVITSRLDGPGVSGSSRPLARLMSVWVRRQGQWQAVAHQATVVVL